MAEAGSGDRSGRSGGARGAGRGHPPRAMRPAIARVRMAFAKGEALRFIGHLDLARAWERALRRADLPVAWTQGFTPRVRLAFAAPLSLGSTADHERVDLHLVEAIGAGPIAARLSAQLPAGCELVEVCEVDLHGPSLPSLVRWAWYEVAIGMPRAGDAPVVEGGSRWTRRIPDDTSIDGEGPDPVPDPGDGTSGQPHPAGSPVELVANPHVGPGLESEGPLRPPLEWLPPLALDEPAISGREVGERLVAFLAGSSSLVARSRDGRTTTIDARAHVISARVLDACDPDGAPVIGLVLRHDASGAGRPEDVATALGFEARSVNRRAIGIEGEAVESA